ncbi:MAG TPA: XrtA system polysaccharide chain length determinant [Gammaproteobacteria bacterium]
MDTVLDRSRGEIAKQTIHDLVSRIVNELRSAWRYRWWGVAVAWACFAAGWVFVASQPNIYEANARFFIDASSVLRPLLRNQIVVPVDLAAQLNYVRQSLLSREHLEYVASVNGLTAEATTPEQLERILTRLRADISLSNRDRNNPSVYSIGYRNANRDTAIGVVTTLLDSLVQNTERMQQQSTDTASRFIEERIAEYEHRLQQAEQALADFKKRHANRLPGTTGGYFEHLRAEREALEEAEKALQQVESRRDQLVSQLESETPVMPSGLGRMDPPPNSLDARIRDYRAQLDSLLLQYTERHPDVVALRETLARLEDQRAEQLRAVGVSNTDQELSALDSNPVYQALRISLNETEAELAARRADVEARRQKVEELQAAIDEVPDVEAELARLNRDYSVIYDQYRSLVQSRETQELSQKAFNEEEIEFRLLDPPNAAFEPVAPNRLLMLAGVFVASLGACGALCWLLAQMNPVFANTAILRQVVGLPVLGSVSHVAPHRQRARRAVEVFAFATSLVGLVGLFAGAVLIEVRGPGLFTLVGLA